MYDENALDCVPRVYMFDVKPLTVRNNVLYNITMQCV